MIFRALIFIDCSGPDQKESRQIMNVETELNSTVNKTPFEFNDFI